MQNLPATLPELSVEIGNHGFKYTLLHMLNQCGHPYNKIGDSLDELTINPAREPRPCDEECSLKIWIAIIYSRLRWSG